MLQDGGAAGAADGYIKDTTTQTFMKDVVEESKRQPVLVDFWAEWCGPCKQLTPVLEKVVQAAKGKVKLAKMDIDKHPAIPGQLGIQSIPAIIAFVNGQPADGFMGALPESQVTAFIERLTKGKVGAEEQDLLKTADAALAEGDPAGAAALYAQLLSTEPENVPALVRPCPLLRRDRRDRAGQADPRPGAGSKARRRFCRRSTRGAWNSPSRRPQLARLGA